MNYFKNYVLDIVEKYAQLNGRASRSEFWFFVILSGVIIFIVGLLEKILGLNHYIDIENIQFVKNISEFLERIMTVHISSLQIIIGLVLLMPFLAIGVRRLHDSCRSAWWYILGLIPFVGALLLTVFFILPSESKTNRYGTVR